MQIRRWIRFIVLGFLLAILMAVTIESSALAHECIDPVTKKVIPCPAADGGGGGGGDKKPTPSPYPSFTPTSTNTPTATATPTATITSTSSPTNTPDGLAVGQLDHGQAAPQAGSAPPPASFDKRNLFGLIVIGSLLVILIGLLLPGLRRGFGGSTKASPTPPPPGMGSSGNGKDPGYIHELTKDQRQNLLLIQRFFDAARHGQVWTFIESEEVQRFLHDAKNGIIGGNIPDGTPGSKFPGTGAKDPLDVLDGLFRGPAFGLGRIDHSGGTDPAQAPEGVEILPNGIRQTIHTDSETGDRTTILTHPDGHIDVWIAHRDGSADGFAIGFSVAGDVTSGNTVHQDEVPGHSSDHGAGYSQDHNELIIQTDTNRREVIITAVDVRHGVRTVGSRTVWPQVYSPGEDGREANTARNPLNNLDVIGPRSLWEMGQALRHPGADSEQHDPNTGAGGRPLTDAERERLGRIVPAAELLDPNSGIDPLTGLHIDPSQMHTRSEDDNRVDPNTGEQPLPGGG